MDEQEKTRALHNLDDYLRRLNNIEGRLNSLDPKIEGAKELRYNKDPRLPEVKREINDTLSNIKIEIMAIKDGFSQYLENQDEEISNQAKEVQSRYKDVFDLFKDKDYQSLLI